MPHVRRPRLRRLLLHALPRVTARAGEGADSLSDSSFPRTREPRRSLRERWIPACAGMTTVVETRRGASDTPDGLFVDTL